MRINQDVCTKCGKCITECHNKAICKGENNSYFIDPALCKNCADVFDVECVRICKVKAIVADDGSAVEYDPTLRLRSEHVIWLMAVLGSRGNKERYPLGTHWDAFRELIAAAYANPDLEVRLTKYFDDNCIGCAQRQDPGHFEACGFFDDICYKQLGIEPGAKMKIWDLIALSEEKFDYAFLKELESISDEVLEDYMAFFNPPGKA